MRWKNFRRSKNVEDVRGQTRRTGFRLPRGLGGRSSAGGRRGIQLPRGKGGKVSIWGIVIMVGIAWLLGINPLTLLMGGGDLGGSLGGTSTSQTTNTTYKSSADETEKKQFVSAVLGSTEDVWGSIFRQLGRTYVEPKLQIFTDLTGSSACGQQSSAAGPFYCPPDQKIFIDLGFFNQMNREFGVNGEFARAYVIAHEVGHHVQNLLGISTKMQQERSRLSKEEGNKLSVKLELQADCFAGVWAKKAEEQIGFLEPGDVESAIKAATAIGDDNLQKKAQGYIVPESFTHGTSAQRVQWFSAGLQNGDINRCDTFN
uniref:Flagellar biosynthesis protein FlgM n=1 Tax=OCS116 cluster bacterium TaxID=2030921 RepID=A0A2A4YUM1_9PROT